MIPFPFQSAGLGRRITSGAGQIIFVTAANPVYATASSVIASTPPSIQTDDLVLAYVFARSDLMPPAGWTLVDSQVCQNSGFPAQTLYVYRKNVVTSADSSTAFTWTQMTSARIGAGYVVARSDASYRGILIRDIAKTAINNTTTLSIAAIPFTAGSIRQDLVIAFCCSIIANIGTAEAISSPINMANCQSGAIVDNRIGAAYQPIVSGQISSSGNFVFAGTPNDNGLATITIRLSAA